MRHFPRRIDAVLVDVETGDLTPERLRGEKRGSAGPTGDIEHARLGVQIQLAKEFSQLVRRDPAKLTQILAVSLTPDFREHAFIRCSVDAVEEVFAFSLVVHLCGIVA